MFSALAELLEGEGPDGLDDEPEQGGEAEAPHERGHGLVAVAGLLGAVEVDREGDGRAEGAEQAEDVDVARVPDLDHERAANHGERRRAPQPALEAAAVGQAQPQQQDERAQVLDDQRHADVEARDREEVGHVHARQTEDAEEGQAGDVLATDPQQGGADEGDGAGEEHEGEHRPQLGQAHGADAVLEQQAGERAVERPHRRRAGGERVTQADVAVASRRHREIVDENAAHGLRDDHLRGRRQRPHHHAEPPEAPERVHRADGPRPDRRVRRVRRRRRRARGHRHRRGRRRSAPGPTSAAEARPSTGATCRPRTRCRATPAGWCRCGSSPR